MAYSALRVPYELDPLYFFFLALSHLDLSQHEKLFLCDGILLGCQKHTFSSLALFVVIQTHCEQAILEVSLCDWNFLTLVILALNQDRLFSDKLQIRFAVAELCIAIKGFEVFEWIKAILKCNWTTQD